MTGRALNIGMVAARALPYMGGIETHVHEVSRRLAASGVQVSVLTTDVSGALPPDETVDGYRVRRWPAYPRSRDYYLSPGLVAHLRRSRYDVVHVQGVHTLAQALPEPELESDSTTVEKLTGGGLSSEAMWPRVGIEIDQSRWGHPLGGVSVRLIGSYTPLPQNFGGEVIASVGGETVDRWPAEAAGVIDRTVTIPDRLLKRFTSLEVAVRTTGNPGRCGDHLPILLRIEGSTAITVQRSDPPVPQGFQSLPQALMPRVRIGMGPDAFGDTVRATQIMVGLQRSSGVPLLVDVTDLDSAINSADPAILISADGWRDKPIALPFTVDEGRLDLTGVDARGQSVTLNLDPAKGFGSLQTVFDGQRSLLIATSTGGPGQLDDLLRYLAAQPGRWAGLDGRAIVAAPGAEPITIPSPRVDYSETPQTADAGDGQEDGWFWWAVGGVAAVAALGALTILVRARRQPSAD